MGNMNSNAIWGSLPGRTSVPDRQDYPDPTPTPEVNSIEDVLDLIRNGHPSLPPPLRAWYGNEPDNVEEVFKTISERTLTFNGDDLQTIARALVTFPEPREVRKLLVASPRYKTETFPAPPRPAEKGVRPTVQQASFVSACNGLWRIFLRGDLVNHAWGADAAKDERMLLRDTYGT